MSEPRQIAQELLRTPEPGRTEELIKILEMVQCAITIRSACRDKHFISMSGGEDSGTKFDRLLKELFGMAWEEPEPKAKRKAKGVIPVHSHDEKVNKF